jgi:hypothetical protein
LWVEAVDDAPRDHLDLEAIRRDLEARRDVMRERLAVLGSRPERGSALGFGKRVGDGTTEAVARLTDIGVADSLERVLAPPLSSTTPLRKVRRGGSLRDDERSDGT